MNLEHPGYPSFEQMRAIETAARRARAPELAQMLRVAAEGLKSYYARLAATVAVKQTRHA